MIPPLQGSELRSDDYSTSDSLFKFYYLQWGGSEDNRTSCGLPDFFQKVPQSHELLPQKLREEARAALLERKSRELLSSDELQDLWFLLDRNQTPPMFQDEKFISYENFKKVRAEVITKARPFFTATVFSKLLRNDMFGRISILSFFNYVMKKIWMQQTRIGISLYDVAGEGYLREGDLEHYITELIPSLCKLSNMDSSFQTFYVCTAVRKFFFFLDPLRSGRVRITDILASGFLDSMLELREPQTTESQLSANWFSHQSALRVYGSYLQLDDDRNGMISRSELSRFANGTLTDVFLDRVFQECLTYEGEMDYKAYLDFVLAMENRQEPQSIGYIYRIVDIGGRGRLTSLTLQHFYAGIERRLAASGHVAPKFLNIQSEIFDMVKPASAEYIVLDDLVKCGKADTVLGMLIDLQSFWAYENREAFVTEQPEEAEL